MTTCGLMSAFMNNIGATAMLLPAVAGISRQARIPMSRLLIPLAFASLLGGNMTLIGTPPNILASSILTEYGLPAFRFFDFTPVGLIIFAIGVLYMVVIGRHLLPKRQAVEEPRTDVRLRDHVHELRVAPNSSLAHRTLLQSRLGEIFDLTVLAIIRNGNLISAIHRDTRLEVNDLLVVTGSKDDRLRAQQMLGLEPEEGHHLQIENIDPDQVYTVDATLAPRSSMVGRTLGETRFRDRYDFTVLAIQRHTRLISQRLRDVPLRFGDILLLQGPKDQLDMLKKDNHFLVLEPVELELRRRNKAVFSVGIMALVLVMTTILGFHISTAMVIGAVAMVLTGCLTMDEAYRSIEWRSVFLIAGMLPLGTAMANTGTARLLADLIVQMLGGMGPVAVMAGIFVLTGLLTQPMSNAAATVLIVPIAIDIAFGLGANAQPFVLATVIGASTSFLTPVGHQANVLIYAPGDYRFFDYTRVGIILTLAILVATLIFVPMLWPLY
jgi:di/tricarboxylate transporter